MMQATQGDAEGTLTYVSSTGSLFLKVAGGWKEIQVTLTKPPSAQRCNNVLEVENNKSSAALFSHLWLQLGSLLHFSSNIIPQDQVLPGRCFSLTVGNDC